MYFKLKTVIQGSLEEPILDTEFKKYSNIIPHFFFKILDI